MPRALLCLLLLVCARPGAGWAATSEEFAAAKSFGGPLRAEVAGYAAQAEAERQLAHEAMRRLAALPEVRFAGQVTPENPRPPDLAALALLLYSGQKIQTRMEGLPPRMHMEVRLAVVGPGNPGAAVAQALARPDVLDLAARLAARREVLLDAYDPAAQNLLRTPAGQGEILGLLEVEKIVAALKALDIMRDLLPAYRDLWPEPARALERLNAALNMDPGLAPAYALRAEVFLKLDKADKAMDDAQAALNLDESLAPAHDALGTALLLRGLPALAVGSFTRAAALWPKNPAYLLHRASARLLLNETEAVCQDLSAACALGDCVELRWAGESGLCPRGPEPAEQTVPGGVR